MQLLRKLIENADLDLCLIFFLDIFYVMTDSELNCEMFSHLNDFRTR